MRKYRCLCSSVRCELPTSDLRNFTESGRVPKLSDIKDKSLTLLVILGTRIEPGESDKAKQQFRFLMKDNVPQPIKLVKEIRREIKIDKRTIVLGPITMIHAERITDFTCKVDGDRASGTVSFKVKNLYQGKVDYVAKRDGNKWKIVQFAMPARDVLITRGDDGKWKKN